MATAITIPIERIHAHAHARAVIAHLASWEGVNALLALALASRFAIANNPAIDGALYAHFAAVVDSGTFWAIFFTMAGGAIAAVAFAPSEVRLAARLALIFWWTWLALFLGAANTDVLTFRFAVALDLFAGVELTAFTARQIAAVRGNSVP